MRALFGSIGAGASLVAVAALSLLTLTAFLAFGGWSTTLTEDLTTRPIVLDGAVVTDVAVEGKVIRSVPSRPVVVTARRQPRARASARNERPADDAVLERPPPPATDFTPATAAVLAPPPQPLARPVAPVVARVVKPTVDIVRELGSDLSATIQSTGTALGAATAPLGPPVSAAVQGVLNIIAELLKSTTDGLTATVDQALQ